MCPKAMILWSCQFLLTNGVFLWQGGFGAGHGPLDGVILLAGFPGMLIFQVLPELGEISDSDWLLLILIPSLLNAGLYWVACRLWKRRHKLGTEVH